MSKPAEASVQSQETLQILRQAVAQELDKKRRLGHYAVVWQDGAPVLTGGDAEGIEIHALRSECTFLEAQLARLPASATLTRMSTAARLNKLRIEIIALESKAQ